MRVCTKCHKELDDSFFGERKEDGITRLRSICKKCASEYSHLVYLRHKKEVEEKGTSKILHKKTPLLRKICTKCSIEKDIKEFPYDIYRDYYGKICKSCSYKRNKQNKPSKISKLTEQRLLLAEGKQICRYCGEIKYVSEMVKGTGTYKVTCHACERKRYRSKHGTEERLQLIEQKKALKMEKRQMYRQKQELFKQGKRICTKCRKEMLLNEFRIKNNPPVTLQDYSSVCKECVKIFYSRPKEARIKQELKIKKQNKIYICDLCKKTLKLEEMGIINRKVHWCKVCQLERKKERERKKNKKKYDNRDSYRKIVYYLRKCLKDSLIGRKNYKTFAYFGCTGLELQKWLESQFTEGMSWDNRGIDGWHIDHYVPISYFDMSKEEDRFICWNYRNLRPLWSIENVKKGNTLPEDYLEHIENIKKVIQNKKIRSI